MKNALLTILAVLSVASTASASFTREENQARLDELQKHRTGTHMSCMKDQNREAVVLFRVDDRVSGMISGNTALAIQDDQICATLGVTCPFIAGYTSRSTIDHHDYWATRGRHEDTVTLVSSGAGMLIASVTNGSNPTVNWKASWYFNSRLCTRR